MEKPVFYIVDVFAEEKYTGNQLAVFRHVTELSDNQMQRIAKEMHFSETTFILSDEKHDGGYDVRIFTPGIELNFAGHPTLGTAFVIQREIIKKPVKEIVLNLKAGKISVFFDYTSKKSCVLWMKQLQPVFGKKFDANLVSNILSLDVRDVNASFPIQEVSTGLPVVVVPLRTLEAVKKARINRDKYFEFIEDIEAKTILIFCPETYNEANDLNVRFFADQYGIPEDPATGSANGCLAGYLVKHRFFETCRINLKVEQGYEIGRPSLLYLRAEKKKQEISVYVGGKVEMIGNGKLV
ncbi:MAG: PhzF family phenazine biosynthesis protein [Candidatus Bathyarchaeota archaeon]